MATSNTESRAIPAARRQRTLMLTQFSILLAIEAVFCFTILGSIPVGPLVATLMMIPVIITALLLGTKAGTLMGFFAGLFSFLVWTFMPPNPMFAFQFTPFYSFTLPSGEIIQGNIWSLVICFVPRILGGTVAGLIGEKLKIKTYISFMTAAIACSLINTFGVLGITWLVFGARVTELAGAAVAAVVGGLILTNGIPEAVVAAVVCPAVCIPVKSFLKKVG